MAATATYEDNLWSQQFDSSAVRQFDTQQFDTQQFDTQQFDTQQFDTQQFDTQQFDTQQFNTQQFDRRRERENNLDDRQQKRRKVSLTGVREDNEMRVGGHRPSWTS